MQKQEIFTSNLLIRKAEEADLAALMAISERTFTETYAQVNTPGNMREYIAANFSNAALTAQMCETGSLFFITWSEDKPAGYLKLNSGGAQTELKEANSLEIERIYVLKAFKKRGIGKLLVEKSIEVAKQLRADFVWLGVWEHNADAIAFYTHLGFAEFNRHVFVLGDDRQTDLMMKLSIQ